MVLGSQVKIPPKIPSLARSSAFTKSYYSAYAFAGCSFTETTVAAVTSPRSMRALMLK